MKYDILDRGSFIDKDQQGFLINNYDLTGIKHPYDKPLSKIINFYLRVFKQKIHSIYIRGSVARGNPILGFSDYDCLAVLLNKCIETEKHELFDSAKKLKMEFDFISVFDLSFCEMNELLEHEDNKHWQFAIKIQSICIYGENLMPKLPKFKPNSEVIFSLLNLQKSIDKSKMVFLISFDPFVTLRRCSWIMRIIVRCGFLLVIEKENEYTNELSLCCKVFSKYYPSKRKQMQECLDLAINPTTNLEVILNLLDNLGQWLIVERFAVFGQ